MERNFCISDIWRQGDNMFTVVLDIDGEKTETYVSGVTCSKLLDINYIRVRTLRESSRVLLGVDQGAWEQLLDDALQEMESD